MDLEKQLGPEWYKLLGPLFSEDWMVTLGKRLGAVGHLRPSLPEVFRAYELCQPSQLKVLIIGQDPYPHKHANGLAFSSTLNEPPLTLKIVFRELERTGYGTRRNCDLTDWASQGVMLLNAILTCEEGKSLAHRGWGWERFVAYTLRAISALNQPIVIMVWGAHAKELVYKYVDWSKPNFNILQSCHPVAESYAHAKVKFSGCNHFVKANQWLASQGAVPIDWNPFDKRAKLIIHE